MKKLVYFSLIVLFVTACKKEEALTPDEKATPLVQPIPGTGSGGGGTTAESFNFMVDGVTITNSNPFYLSNLGSSQISSTLGSFDNLLQFGFLVDPTGRDTVALGGFAPSATFYENQDTAYYAINGELIITEATASKISGSFYFDATTDPPSDTISITEGSFSVNK